MTPPQEKRSALGLAIAMVAGSAIGLWITLGFDNMAAGIGVGGGVGTVLGFILTRPR